jgi:hypothetical protein
MNDLLKLAIHGHGVAILPHHSHRAKPQVTTSKSCSGAVHATDCA